MIVDVWRTYSNKVFVFFRIKPLQREYCYFKPPLFAENCSSSTTLTVLAFETTKNELIDKMFNGLFLKLLTALPVQPNFYVLQENTSAGEKFRSYQTFPVRFTIFFNFPKTIDNN